MQKDIQMIISEKEAGFIHESLLMGKITKRN